MTTEARKRVQVGSIILNEQPGGNLAISTAHQGGLIHNGMYVIIERADRHDLLDALRQLLAQEAS